VGREDRVDLRFAEARLVAKHRRLVAAQPVFEADFRKRASEERNRALIHALGVEQAAGRNADQCQKVARALERKLVRRVGAGSGAGLAAAWALAGQGPPRSVQGGAAALVYSLQEPERTAADCLVRQGV